MKKPTAAKKATPAPATAKAGSQGMMVSGKSTGTANPTSTSALGKMPAAAPKDKKPEPAPVKKVETKTEEVKVPQKFEEVK